MHTVEQAALLWCPHGRVGVLPSAGGPAAINDPSSLEFHTSCIGAQCSAWRWEKPFAILIGQPYPPKALGYCGLAGKP